MSSQRCRQISLTLLIIFVLLALVFYELPYKKNIYWMLYPRLGNNSLGRIFSHTSRTDRVLCVILTVESHKDNIAAVNSTWVKRCDRHMFIMANKDNAEKASLRHDILTVKSPENKARLKDKMRLAIQFVHSNCMDEFDWLLKADDDTYVIMDNLKNLLQHTERNQSSKLFMGLRLKPRVKMGVMSGGAGYVMNKEALRLLVESSFTNKTCSTHWQEDVHIAKCLEDINVTIVNSLDETGRQKFHAEPLERYLHPPHPMWLVNAMHGRVKFGPDCCSQFPISFHHLTPGQIKLYEQLIYKTKVLHVD